MGFIEILLAVCMIVLMFLHFCAMVALCDEVRKLRSKIDCAGPNYTHSLEKISKALTALRVQGGAGN